MASIANTPPALSPLRLRRQPALRARAARGDARAFALLYQRHHQALYRYCRSIVQDDQDAQDALQSTMARAFAALRDEPRDFELRPWLFRIAHNEAVTILRRRRPSQQLDDVAGADDTVEERVSEREDVRTLRGDLAELPERQRAALVLRELNGLGHAEIAGVLGSTPRAVKQVIYEARSALLECREGREMACEQVRRMLSDGDGRVLRGRRLRAHLRACRSCRLFQNDLVQRPRELALLAPPLPAGAAAAVLRCLFPTSGTVAAGGSLASKAAVTAAAVAVAAGGGEAIVHSRAESARAPGREAAPAPRPVSAPVRVTAPPARDDYAHGAPAGRALGHGKPWPRGRALGHTKPAPRGRALGHAKAKAKGGALGHAKPAGGDGRALGHTKVAGANGRALGRAKPAGASGRALGHDKPAGANGRALGHTKPTPAKLKPAKPAPAVTPAPPLARGKKAKG